MNFIYIRAYINIQTNVQVLLAANVILALDLGVQFEYFYNLLIFKVSNEQ